MVVSFFKVDACMNHFSRFYNPACEERLRSAILEASPVLDDLTRAGGRAYLFAGAVRDVVAAEKLQLREPRLRDFDIGVEGLSRPQFQDILRSHRANNNRYCGFRWKLSNDAEIDCWRLEDTVGLWNTKSFYSLENVIRSFVLVCNAIYFDLATGVFTDYGAVNSLSSGVLDFVDAPLIHSEGVFAAKALVYERRFGFKLASRLKNFSDAHVDAAFIENEVKKWKSTIQSRLVNNDSYRSHRPNRQLP
jgi:hypothetical protein